MERHEKRNTGEQTIGLIIRAKIFSKNFGRKIAQAEEIRHASDCDDFYIATKEKAEEQDYDGKRID